MTLISFCPLPNYNLTFNWALLVRLLAGVREAKTTSVYQRLPASTNA